MWPWDNPFQADVMPVQPQLPPEIMQLPFVPGQDATPQPLPQPFNPTETPAEVQLLQAPQMSAVVNPSPVVKAPPSSPEDLEQRKAGWMNVFDKIQNDPQTRMLTMMMGHRLLQGRKPGQSTMGGLADAALIGAAGSAMMDENARAQDIKAREMKMKEAESAALVGERTQRTAKDKQSMEFDAQEQPTRLEKLRQDAKTSALKLRAAELQAVVDEKIAQNDPTGAKRAQQALDKIQAEISRDRAAAGASVAAAKASNARTTGSENENKWRAVLANPKSTAEEVAAAERALRGGKTEHQQAADKMKFQAEWIKKANPTWTEEQVAQATLELSTGKKGETFDALKLLYENATTKAEKDLYGAKLKQIAMPERAPIGAKPVTGGNADMAAWEAARNSVKIGQTYVGPDGKTYTRTK